MLAVQREGRPEHTGVRGAGWSLLGSPPGRFLMRRLCAVMAHRFERRRGLPQLEGRRRIVRLWRVDAYRSVSLNCHSRWRLGDGTLLAPGDPVLELHVSGADLIEVLQHEASWKTVLADEFSSLVPELERREEIAIVGSTILQRQAAAFGASLRAAPATLYCTLDEFYRKLILLAFHPAGFRRVLSQKDGLADAAISREQFCRLFRPR